MDDNIADEVPARTAAHGSSAHTCVGEVAALFLDVDGTLMEYAPRPDLARVDPDLLQLLAELRELLGGALALVSGRTIAELDALFAPLQLPLGGLHGIERRSTDGLCYRPTDDGANLAPARVALTEMLAHRPGLLLEDKGRALALHYRSVPHAAEFARLALSRVAAQLPNYELLEGDQVIEIKPADHNKATAVEAFLQEAPFRERTPAYLGDDYTDFDGFSAMRRYGGFDIAVGERVSARWHLAGPAEVRRWLLALRNRLRDGQ